MTNWIKITKENRPNFEEIVWLVQMPAIKTKDSKIICCSGKLIKIDANGMHFDTGGFGSTMNDLFGGMFGGDISKKLEKFNPTHYAEIDLPKD